MSDETATHMMLVLFVVLIGSFAIWDYFDLRSKRKKKNKSLAAYGL